jgi:hypothetical protein
MERIVIEVNDATAKKWRNVSPEIKSQIEKGFEKQVELLSQEEKESDFENLLNKAREEAARNGLTEDILQQLLKDE